MVAAGALALLASVVGVVVLAEEGALWSDDVAGAAELAALVVALGLAAVASAAEVPAAAPALEA